MKKNIILSFILATSMLCSCNEKQDSEEKTYTTFNEYTEIVKAAQGDEKNIFIFTQTGCSSCKTIDLYFNQYKEDYSGLVNIYEITIDSEVVKKETVFKDSTLGKVVNDSKYNYLKALDNRITKFISDTGIEAGYDKDVNLFFESPYYTYVYTPLIIFYLGNLEVKVCNNLDALLEKDRSGVATYESFCEYFEYPEVFYNWSYDFDLTGYDPDNIEEDED